ncbi:Ig-like domain-containing protein [Agaribacillus aureus]
MAMAEGTREYRPAITNFGNIRIGDALQPDLAIRFATYAALPTEQLKIRIKDPAREVIYYGFNISLGGNVYVRIKDPNGNIVVSATLIPGSGTGNIGNFGQAVIGPVQISAGGYDAWMYEPTMSGDYVIEFNAGNPNTHTGDEFIIDLFDITVYDQIAGQVQNGRLWSQKWAGNTDSFDNPFIGKYYIYSPADSTLSVFEPNGMKPFTFEIFANSTGPFNTGSVVNDRKSANSKAGSPEYFLFLNPPDSTVFPYARSEASFTSQPTIEACVSGFCIDFEVNKNGYVEIFIELNGVAGYQSGTEDVTLFLPATAGANQVTWNGLDNFGTDVSERDDIVVNIDYGTSPTHIPIFDVESNPNGFMATTLKPVFQVEELHFDDSNLVNGLSDIEGCEAPCHIWVPVSGCCNSIGNARTVNTWWFTNKTSEAYWINATNLAPVVQADVADTTLAETPVTVDYASNDSDPNNNLDPDSFQIINGPMHGTVNVDPGSGTITYTPDAGYMGPDTLTYQICDTGLPVRCGEAMIFFVVSAANVPPVAVDDVYTIESSELLIVDNLANDSDPDNNLDPSTLTILSGPLHGNLVNDENGRLIYVPDETYVGLDSIQYSICDSALPPLCDEAMIRIEVTPSSACQINIYTGISPNGDGFNDSWIIEGISCFPDNELQIFNRWGNLIFKTTGYNNQNVVWGGEVNTGLLIKGTKMAPNGTYFYILRLKELDEKYSGYIVLNR